MTTQTRVRSINDILDKLNKVKKISSGEYEALCPAHNDTIPSLHIKQDKDKVLMNCKAGCHNETIVRALGLTMSDLSLDHSPPPDKKIITTYPYHNADGKIIYEVVRYEPKAFKQRRTDGAGGYIWNIEGINPVLYKLPNVIKAVNEGRYVIVVEGEKDVATLTELGLIATCNPMGADKWRDEYSDTLAGANVVVIPDNDVVGRNHANQVANSLYGKTKTLKVVELRDASDVTEWMKSGGTKDYLQELIKKEPEYIPLKEPRVNHLGSVFELHWDSLNILAEVKNVAETSSGVYGEVRIKDTITGERYLSSRFNFLSDSTKNSIAKRLQEREGINWANIVETICEEVIERHRTGNPLMRKNELPPIVQDPFRVYPIILEGLPTIYYGYGGSLKSYLLKLIALLTNNGISHLGFEPTKGNTLFLDFENDEQTYNRRMTAIQGGLGRGELDFPLYKDCRGKTLPQLLPEIQKQVLENDIKLAIVDSMTMAAGGYEYEQSIEYFKAIASLRIASVTVDHRAKGLDKGSSPIGAVIKSNIARIVFEVTAEQETGINYADLTVKNVKNNDNAKLPHKGYRVEFENLGRITTRVKFEEQEPRTLEDIIGEASTKERLLQHFKKVDNTYETPTEITISTGGSADANGKFMRRNPDIFEADGKGRWHIKDEVFDFIIQKDKDTDNPP